MENNTQKTINLKLLSKLGPEGIEISTPTQRLHSLNNFAGNDEITSYWNINKHFHIQKNPLQYASLSCVINTFHISYSQVGWSKGMTTVFSAFSYIFAPLVLKCHVTYLKGTVKICNLPVGTEISFSFFGPNSLCSSILQCNFFFRNPIYYCKLYNCDKAYFHPSAWCMLLLNIIRKTNEDVLTKKDSLFCANELIIKKKKKTLTMEVIASNLSFNSRVFTSLMGTFCRNGNNFKHRTCRCGRERLIISPGQLSGPFFGSWHIICIGVFVVW